MIDRILSLLTEHGISAYKLSKDLGLPNSAITEWKKGKGKPSTDAIVKIANYFNVTADYLLCLSDTPERRIEDNPILTAYNSLNDIGKQKANDYINDLSDNPKYVSLQPESSASIEDIYKEYKLRKEQEAQVAAHGKGVHSVSAPSISEEEIKEILKNNKK